MTAENVSIEPTSSLNGFLCLTRYLVVLLLSQSMVWKNSQTEYVKTPETDEDPDRFDVGLTPREILRTSFDFETFVESLFTIHYDRSCVSGYV